MKLRRSLVAISVLLALLLCPTAATAQGGGAGAGGAGAGGAGGLGPSGPGDSGHPGYGDSSGLGGHELGYGILSRSEIHQRRDQIDAYRWITDRDVYLLDIDEILERARRYHPRPYTPPPPPKPVVVPTQPKDLVLHCGPNTVCGPSQPATGVTSPNVTGSPGQTVSPDILSPLLGRYLLMDLSFPFVTALLRQEKPVCSGVYLGDGKILTAAHCFCEEPPSDMFIGSSTLAGDVTDIGFRKTYSLTDTAHFFDEEYCRKAEQGETRPLDLAVVRTAADPSLPARFALAWEQRIAPLDSQGIVVGFGASDHSNHGGVKRYAVLTAQLCSEEDRERSRCLENREYIARNPKGVSVDTCLGDSGGPLLHLDSSGNFFLAGVTSRKIPDGSERFCGSGGIYTSVHSTDIQEWLSGLP